MLLGQVSRYIYIYILYIYIPYIQRSATLRQKRNGVTRYRLCHVLRAITFGSDNGSNLDTAITLRRDNGSSVPRAITIRNDNFAMICDKALCDNAICNVALSL
jgi:hypothetical protein